MSIWEMVALWGVLVISLASAIVVIILQRAQMVRYDKFRNEVAWTFAYINEVQGDMNRRLTAAGYPAGALTPNTETPDWFRRGVMPDGQPAPVDYRR